MPGISSATLCRLGEEADVQDVSNQNAKRRRAHLEFNIADISPPPAGRGHGKPRPTRTQPGGLRALSPLIRRLARPLSERQRDAHCGIAYFVGEHAILDRARQHHTANA
jgi:hypothetical protein